MSTLAPNPAYGAGLPYGWNVQNALANNNGGGDQSLVDGGSAPSSGLGFASPGRNGLIAWTFDTLFTTTGGSSPATGKQVASKFYWPGGNMSYLWVHATSAPTTQTHGWLAVYDGNGTLWANTADFGATALTTSPAANKVALSAVTAVPAGWYYGYAVFVFSVGTLTLDKFSGTVTGSGINDNLVAGTWSFAYDSTDTVTTSLPASLTWGTNWAADTTYMVWFGVS